MSKTSVKWFIPFFFVFAALIPGLMAEDSDEVYWQKKGALAHERILRAYRPNPIEVVHHFNKKTQEALDRHFAETVSVNVTTRRSLGRKYTGPCMATNPIDRCWRCDPNWATDRQRYADCVQGFGEGTTGGKGGPIYVVTDSSDNDMVNPKVGTLRHAVIQNGPLWIIFKTSMTIKLNGELIVSSNKTIDGRGAVVRIMDGAGITIQGVQNVIISNIKISNIQRSPGGLIRDSVDHFGFRTPGDGDGISIFTAHNIWLDHLSMSKAQDGLIDAVMGSTAITISNCHFVRHDKVLLFGGRDGDTIDSIMQITLAFNHFGRFLVQRMPRCRRGFFHLVNNDYSRWLMYAIGGSHNATIISQGNQYTAPDPIGKKLVTHREAGTDEFEWKKWTWVTDHDVFKNGAVFIPSGDPEGAATFEALEKIKPAPGDQVSLMTQFSGHRACIIGRPC